MLRQDLRARPPLSRPESPVEVASPCNPLSISELRLNVARGPVKSRERPPKESLLFTAVTRSPIPSGTPICPGSSSNPGTG